MKAMNGMVTALLFGHPLHSMVVHFPIALTSVGLLAILLALWRKSDIFEQFAFFSVILAAAGSAVAGVTGFADHLIRFGGETPYGGVKIFLGSSLLALTTVMAISRWRYPELLWSPSTRILYVAGFVSGFLLAGALGFVGGTIVYGS